MCCNRCAASKVGLNDPNEIIGKTDYDLFGKAEADVYRKNDLIVIEEGKELAVEEIITLPDAEKRVHLSIKRPLYSKNESGIIIGLIGNTVDITAQKETQRLKLESELQRVTLQEKEKFVKIAHKVSHDINSPLAALRMILQMCDELPEKKRTILHNATENILDIANNLLTAYNKEHKSITSEIESRQPVLVSDLLNQLLSEKKTEYRDRPVAFDAVIEIDAQFAFINIQRIEFRRCLSNLINNAVDALEDKADGMIAVQLTANGNTVLVKIQDNGKGMTSNMIEKMQGRESFTEGKENGHGLGLQQVWDTLEYNQGAMEIRSSLGKGTSIQLFFSQIAAANWIAQELDLIPDNIIVILDDDESIHAAWNLRFEPCLISYPALQLHHFTLGQKVLDFVADLRQEEKERLLFLSDYELLHQPRNGLQIIEASGIKRSILVTSYYANLKVRDSAVNLGIRVLPKQMASVIPIRFPATNVSQVNPLPIQIPPLEAISDK